MDVKKNKFSLLLLLSFSSNCQSHEGYFGRASVRLMGEVSLISPGSGVIKPLRALPGKGGTGGDLSFHGVPSCWDGIKTWLRRRGTTPLSCKQVNQAFQGRLIPISLPQKALPVPALLFSVNTGN